MNGFPVSLRLHDRITRAWTLGMLLLLPGVAAYPQTTDTESVCSVSVLNQTALVNDRSWTLPNIPANMGPLRARLTCIDGDQVESGSSELFLVKPNVMNAIPEIPLGTPAPTVASIDENAGHGTPHAPTVRGGS